MKNTRTKLVMLLAIFGVAFITLNFLPGFHKSEIYIVSNNEVNEWLIKPDGSNIPVDELFAIPPPTMPLHSEMVPNGDFLVTFFNKDNEEIISYSVYADEFVRKNSINIPEKAKKFSVKKVNGNKAHIDAIISEDGNLKSLNLNHDSQKKISAYDGDLINMNENSIEFQIENSPETLDLFGRIEGELMENPFFYPETNSVLDKIDETASFYPYTPKSFNAVKDFDEKSCYKKFFSVPATGHPLGYTYIWAWNDKENLYVKLDITCDNTNDSDGDYATLYVKNQSDVNSYRISATESDYGQTVFTYTDKVKYAHKVYDFVIPVAEIDDIKNTELAFNFYGTVGQGSTEIFNIGSITNTTAEITFVSGDPGGLMAITGLVWNTTGNPTISMNDGSTQQSLPQGGNLYVTTITNLTPGQHYYIRSYIDYQAIFKFNTSYSTELEFTTTGGTPTPLSNWPLIIGGILLITAGVLAYRKKRTA